MLQKKAATTSAAENNRCVFSFFALIIYIHTYVLVELGNWGKEETQTERRKLQYIFA